MSIVEDRPTTTPAAAPTLPRGRQATAVISATVAGAVAVDLVIRAIGELAGGSFELATDGDVQSAAPGGVVLLTAVPLAAGMSDFDTESTVALSSMHLALVPFVLIGLDRLRRR